MKRKGQVETDGYRHPEQTRKNLPTEKTAGYMDEAKRRPVVYEPDIRSPEGPVLAWDRSDQDQNLKVRCGPLYIREKLSPAAMLHEMARTKSTDDLFGPDFNNLPEGAQYESYEHEGNWQNRMIQGPSLEIMGSLLAKEQRHGKAMMVYCDPPYGIQFKSNMQGLTTSRRVGDKASDRV